MRLSVITDEISQDLARALDLATAVGFDGIEVRSVWNVAPHRLTDEQLATIRSDALASGLAVVAFDPPALKQPRPRSSEELAQCRTALHRGVQQARVLGAPYVRMFSFYREDRPEPELAAGLVRDLLPDLDTAGVTLLIETGTRTNTPTLRHALRFLDVVDDERLAILWDPGNAVFGGWDPVPFPADYAAGRDRIRHVHVKDPDATRGYVELGSGDLPWPAIVEALAEDGYEGYLSLETHWRMGRCLTAEQRDEPWGDAFSEGGLSASLACMKRLAAMAQPFR